MIKKNTRPPRFLPKMVPYPKNLIRMPGGIHLSQSVKIQLSQPADQKLNMAAEMVQARLAYAPQIQSKTKIQICSISTTLEKAWLSPTQNEFLSKVLSDQAYVLSVNKGGVLIAGKTSLGLLYGVQTFLQLIDKSSPQYFVQFTEIFDSPTVENRILSIPMTWYAGYGRIGFGSQLWNRDQWFWFVDWCLRHKINGINLCIYGYYPFEFEPYPESVFKNVEARTWIAEAGAEMKLLFTHSNVQSNFLPELIRYANERAITVLCYFGLNTFNGGYALAHPESRFYSENPEKFHQFKYNLCPSRLDVIEYLDSSVKKLLELGFNGIVFEESEGSGFCECQSCKKYFGNNPDPRNALHKANYELFNHLYSVIRKEKPEAIIGIRMWRMGSELDANYLRDESKQIPPDILVFWSNGLDPERFKGWVEAIGPERLMGQDAEALGFSTLYDGLLFLLPEQYSNYLKYVDHGFKPEYPQSLYGDIMQYQLAAQAKCRGVTGFAFNWNGWEIAPLSLSQYGWNPNAFLPKHFLLHGYQHQFGESGKIIAKVVANLPIVLETRICEGFSAVLRVDPVSGGLAGLTSLQVPTKFGEGKNEIRALAEDMKKAQTCLRLLNKVHLNDDSAEEQNRISLNYLKNAAKRTILICKAGIEYRRARRLERRNGKSRSIALHYSKSLKFTMEDYRIVRESSFDLTEEFHARVTNVIETISQKIGESKNRSKLRLSAN